jgi:hypothetical protein
MGETVAIPKTMKAAVVEHFGAPLVVREVPVPTPGPGQALVEISATGVCHTDLHAADGDWPVKTKRFVSGHEGAGTGCTRSGGHTLEGRGSGRNRMAAQRVRALRLLFVRLGNAVP